MVHRILQLSEATKFPDDFLGNVVCADTLKAIKRVPDESVGTVIADPPYGLNRKGIKNDADLALFYNVLPELHRVMKRDAWFISFFSTKHIPKIFVNNPFKYFWQMVLYSPEACVMSPIGITKFMSVFIFKKGSPKINKRTCDIIKDTPGRLIEPDEGFINHPTPKPKHFIIRLLEAFSSGNDIIFDPFVGSGSSLLAAKLLNRCFFGFEIEHKFCKLACKRLNGYQLTEVPNQVVSVVV